ncbi:MAG: hypothetical protein BWY86_00653 [Candidatus Aminicenantes bacterium ADurb.Bin508]|nr:MAG: hypothetical protein BWY86_00653 [Candidatus Aminicenantes bacterium ADurb.Bin508]
MRSPSTATSTASKREAPSWRRPRRLASRFPTSATTPSSNPPASAGCAWWRSAVSQSFRPHVPPQSKREWRFSPRPRASSKPAERSWSFTSPSTPWTAPSAIRRALASFRSGSTVLGSPGGGSTIRETGRRNSFLSARTSSWTGRGVSSASVVFASATRSWVITSLR